MSSVDSCNSLVQFKHGVSVVLICVRPNLPILQTLYYTHCMCYYPTEL